jgi:hypothetical protein
MLSVVHLSDCPKLEFIQPHCCFVISVERGRPGAASFYPSKK